MSMITELVEKLRNIAGSEGFYDDRFPSDKAATIKMAADTIEELSEKLHNSQMERSSQHYNGGWIPCSERLPVKQGYYLATITSHIYEKHIVRTVWYDMSMWSFWGMTENVIAWRPLPEPYNEIIKGD